MVLQHDALPRSVGRLRAVAGDGSTAYGTGFLITPTRVLTCAHALRGLRGDRADRGTISFTQARDTVEVPFEVVFDRLDPDIGIDAAVLSLRHPVEGTACLTLSSEDLTAQPAWQSFGHPVSIERAPLWLSGKVDGRIARRVDGKQGWLLSLHVEGDPAPIAGMSGAPVLTDDGVIGILSYQLFKREHPENGGTVVASPAFSKAFAVPVQLLQSLPAFSQSFAGTSRVFIAYRRHSREAKLVEQLQHKLKAAGHFAFIDLDIQVGQDWARQIQSTIEQADFFVPVLSEESIDSPMLLREVRMAYRHQRQTGRPIILPIRDPAVEALPFEFDSYIGQLQYASWSGEADTTQAIGAITQAVESQVIQGHAPGTQVLATRVSQRPPASLQSPDRVRIRPYSFALPLDDPFYLERQADAEAYDRLDADKLVMTIRAPSGFGKTSLAMRLRQRCITQGRHVLLIDFQAFGRLPEDDGAHRGYVTFLNDFARVLCRGLKISRPPQPLEDPMDLQEVLLGALDSMPRLVMILDGVDRVIARPYGEDFFSTCRAWINDVMLSFSFIFCIATEPSVLIRDANRSPFNIDRAPLVLKPFGSDAVKTLARRAGYRLKDGDLHLLHLATGGHPALTRQALAYVLAPNEQGNLQLTEKDISARVESVHEHCGSLDGPFSSSLKVLLSRFETAPLQRADDPTLMEVMRKIIKNSALLPAETRLAQKLVALGMVRTEGTRFAALNLAYARFFGSLP